MLVVVCFLGCSGLMKRLGFTLYQFSRKMPKSFTGSGFYRSRKSRPGQESAIGRIALEFPTTGQFLQQKSSILQLVSGPWEGNGRAARYRITEKRKKLDSLSGLVNNWSRTSRTSRFLLFLLSGGEASGASNYVHISYLIIIIISPPFTATRHPHRFIKSLC